MILLVETISLCSSSFTATVVIFAQAPSCAQCSVTKCHPGFDYVLDGILLAVFEFGILGGLSSEQASRVTLQSTEHHPIERL
jgi:hypothetical protein